MSKYAIVVDYFMWDVENDKEYTEKKYLYIKGKHKIYVFHNTPDVHEDELELKSFATRREAMEYIDAHNLNENICYENVRPERILTEYEFVKPLYELPGMTVTLNFSEDNLNYLREKFEIKSKKDLLDVIYECITTYMEM